MEPQIAFSHCLKCGSNWTLTANSHFTCPDCGYQHYLDPLPTSNVIIQNELQELLLIFRADDPQKHTWDFPGGFVNNNESLEECARREIKEELGIKLNNLIYLLSVPDHYLFQGVKFFTITCFFIARVESHKIEIKLNPEIAEYKFFSVNSIPRDKIGFKSIIIALDKFTQNETKK